MSQDVKDALKACSIIGSGALFAMFLAFATTRVNEYRRIDYKGAWPNVLHDMPKDDARSSIVSVEE